MGLLATLHQRSLENPSTPLSAPDDWLFDSLGSFRASSGVNVNRETALTYDAYWRCIALISGDVAKLPVTVYKQDDLRKIEDRQHAAFHLLMYEISKEITSLAWKRVTTVHALSEGNGYSYIQRNGAGRPAELWPLNPMKTFPVREDRRLWYVTQIGNSNEQRKIPAEDMFHLMGLSFDGLVGYSAVAKMRETLGLGLAAQNFGSIFFRNNARPNVVLKHPGKLKKEAKINLRESWERMHGGLENAHRTAVLEEGMDLVALMHNARDSQLLELKAFSRVEVCNFFGVPPHKVGDNSRTSYNSLEQENEAYVEDGGGLGYWLPAFAAEAWRKLLSDEEKAAHSHTIGFQTRGLLRANVTARTQYYIGMVGIGAMSPNDVRAEEGFNPRAGGDIYVTPTSPQGGLPKPKTPPADAGGSGGAQEGKALPAPLRNLLLAYDRGGKKPKRDTDAALAALANLPDVDKGVIAVMMPVELKAPYQVDESDLVDLPTRTVRIAKLYATQATVKRPRVASFIRDPDRDDDKSKGSSNNGNVAVKDVPGDRPYVVRCAGVNYLYDGHHRVTALQLTGVEKVKVYYYKVE